MDRLSQPLEAKEDLGKVPLASGGGDERWFDALLGRCIYSDWAIERLDFVPVALDGVCRRMPFDT